jgi:hypothetical protein
MLCKSSQKFENCNTGYKKKYYLTQRIQKSNIKNANGLEKGNRHIE